MTLIIRRLSKLVLLCLKLKSAQQNQRAVTDQLPAGKQAPVGVTFSLQTQRRVEEMTLSRSIRSHRASALPHAIWAGEALIGGWSISCSQRCQVGEDVTTALPSPHQSVPALCCTVTPLPTVAARLWTLEHVRLGRRSASIPVASGGIAAALRGRAVVNDKPQDPARLSGRLLLLQVRSQPSLPPLALSGTTASGKISTPSGDDV